MLNSIKISRLLSNNWLKIRNFHISTTLNQTVKIQELKLKDYGNPETSVGLEECDIEESDVKNGKIMVKLVGAPVNPADINIIQGKYALLPDKLPAVIGNEGVFRVIKTSNSNKFKPGDLVLPTNLGWGTWRSHAIDNEDLFIKIPACLDSHTCATLSVNPCTAYRMLHDYKTLKENDTIIQNGANSGVGQSVIQFAKELKINVINVVRKRDNMDELYAHLKSIGAKYIVTDEDLRKASVIEGLLKEIKRPVLALNCVGGRNAADMVRLLDRDAILVTYGGMSRLPLTFNTADFIFKNLKCAGFWLSYWRKTNSIESYEKMIFDICRLIDRVKFVPQKFQEFKLSEYQDAFKNAQSQFLDKKSLFVN